MKIEDSINFHGGGTIHMGGRRTSPLGGQSFLLYIIFYQPVNAQVY